MIYRRGQASLTFVNASGFPSSRSAPCIDGLPRGTRVRVNGANPREWGGYKTSKRQHKSINQSQLHHKVRNRACQKVSFRPKTNLFVWQERQDDCSGHS